MSVLFFNMMNGTVVNRMDLFQGLEKCPGVNRTYATTDH